MDGASMPPDITLAFPLFDLYVFVAVEAFVLFIKVLSLEIAARA